MLNAVHHGGGIPKTAHLRSLAKRLFHLKTHKLIENGHQHPQDILQDSHPFNTDIFNLISWIIDPRVPIGEDGMVKISSKRKSLKIQQISRNLVSLMPSAQPSLDQVLLSLILHLWSAFQSITSRKPSLCEVNVGYLPHLIYHKVLDVMFQLPDKFQNVIVKMGGFHIVLCMMRSIYSRFREFGLVHLLSSVGGLGGQGTIESALKGGNVKTGITLYKLLFEAFYRIKIRSFEELSLASESNELNLLRELVNRVKCHVNYMGLDELVNRLLNKKMLQTSSKGDVATWIDSFLEMVQLMLNTVHFYRISN